VRKIEKGEGAFEERDKEDRNRGSRAKEKDRKRRGTG
jgi:hypothetical protein